MTEIGDAIILKTNTDFYVDKIWVERRAIEEQTNLIRKTKWQHEMALYHFQNFHVYGEGFVTKLRHDQALIDNLMKALEENAIIQND